MSDSDLSQIRNSVNVLARNQQTILHSVKESLSILNISRVQITENRHTLTELIVALQRTNDQIKKISEAIEKKITQLEKFIDIYLKLDLIIDELKQMTQCAMFYLENIRLQLNLLSMGRLSPSISSPNNLRSLLLEIKARLPTTLKLPKDPASDMHYHLRSRHYSDCRRSTSTRIEWEF